MALLLLIPVVVAALQDMDAVVLHLVDHAVFIVYGAIPPARKVAFERLGVSKAVIAVALDVGEQTVYFLVCFLSCACQYR